MWSFFFYPIPAGILIFTNYYKGFNPTSYGHCQVSW